MHIFEEDDMKKEKGNELLEEKEMVMLEFEQHA